jgi:hypothetical protein
MAELVDALVSGTSDRKVVQVRLLFWVLYKQTACNELQAVCFTDVQNSTA